MRTAPTEADADEMAELNAEPWMLALLALNPSYPYWGPHEDYMWKEGESWDSRVILPTWDKMWALDDLNECVNFYFSVERASESCQACGESGYNPATRRIADDFYDFAGRGTRWCSAITEDEAAALWEAGRLRLDFKEKPTATQVNEWNSAKSLGHDAINRWILVETRAKRLGIYGKCETCGGKGYMFTAPTAHVSLTLWMLHPRKGCSRGVEVSRIERSDLPAVFKWLREAATRNTERFAAVTRGGTPDAHRPQRIDA